MRRHQCEPLAVIVEQDGLEEEEEEYAVARIPLKSESDFVRLKAVTTRLNLSTRRPSYVAWRAQYLDAPAPEFPESGKETSEEKLTEERKQKINDALQWIRNELSEMRSVDQMLATRLLSLRSEMHQLKLERSCENHRDLLDDVETEMWERDKLAGVCDLTYGDDPEDNPLKHLGVTKMNISRRRFSTC